MAVSKVILNGTTLIDITDTTAEAGDVVSPEIFYGADGEQETGAYSPPTFSTQTKTVTPTTSTQTVAPDQNYDGLSQVTVNPIPSSYIVPTGTMSISQNGLVDVTQYASANVNVEGGGGGMDVYDFLEGKYAGSLYDRNSVYSGAMKSYFFKNWKSLTAVDFPNLQQIGVETFANCTTLSDVNFPKVLYLSSSAFANCTSLKVASFPVCTYVGNSAFNYCTSLTTANFPVLKSLASYVFYSCTSLTIVDMPLLTSIYASAFMMCTALSTIRFSSLVLVGSNVFRSCYALESAYFLTSNVPLLSANVFLYTPMSDSSYLGHYGSIFVKASLLESFKTANSWGWYSARMVGLTDEEIAALE